MSTKIDYSNVYEKYMSYFDVEHLDDESISEQIEKHICFGYLIKSIEYKECGVYKQILLDMEGNEIYSWYVYGGYDFLNFSNVIEHSDGEKYFIFKECLYGYSVIRLSDRKMMHYIPQGYEKSGESFIMTAFSYEPQNNYLAADGCYWAGPADVIVIKMENPISEPQCMIEIHEQIDPDYEHDELCDIEFKEWRECNLVVKADNGQEFSFLYR